MSLIRPLLIAAACVVGVATHAHAEQTLVFLRHGEKPANGYGQLTCQGFNRAMALPNVLVSKFGTPDYLYAPSPAVQITDPGGAFYYVRPLATLEPTAVKLGMPMRTKYGWSDIASLQAALITATKADATIFIAWEHTMLQKVVQNIMNAYGNHATVPAWITGDYDSLYVVRVSYVGDTITARFEKDSENLNNQPTSCSF